MEAEVLIWEGATRFEMKKASRQALNSDRQPDQITFRRRPNVGGQAQGAEAIPPTRNKLGWREKGDSQRRTREYEDHHSLDTGGILRLYLTHRSVCIGWFTRLWLVATGVLRVSANVLFLRRHRDDPDASRVASSTAAID
jgi:hypothetical protein